MNNIIAFHLSRYDIIDYIIETVDKQKMTNILTYMLSWRIHIDFRFNVQQFGCNIPKIKTKRQLHVQEKFLKDINFYNILKNHRNER